MKRHSYRAITRLITVLSLLGLVLATIPLASAANLPLAKPAQDSGNECVITGELKQRNEPSAPDPEKEKNPPTPVCFNTFAEAVEYATAGKVKMPKDASRKEIKEAVKEYQKKDKDKDKDKEGSSAHYQFSNVPATAQGAFIIAYLYAGINYTEGSLTISVNGERCDDPSYATYATDVMPSGWNDRLSSAEEAGYGCKTIDHFEHGFRQGRVYPCQWQCSWLDWMNDRTSSVYYWCDNVYECGW